MTNVAKRNLIAWALVVAPVLFFIVSLLMGQVSSGTQMFWALMLASHMPVVAVPFWAVFHGRRTLAILLGWLMCILGEVGFFAFYLTYFKRYGWPSPEPPLGIVFAALFGWLFSWLLAECARAMKERIDRRWPIRTP